MRGPNPIENTSTRIPRRRASAMWPASWAAMSRPRPTTVTSTEITGRQCRAQVRPHSQQIDPGGPTFQSGDHLREDGMKARTLGFFASVLAALACSHNQEKPAPKGDDSGLSRLNEDQMQPVDDARVEEGRARDALARSRANE